MTDEQLLDRLRADLDDFVGEPGPVPGVMQLERRRRPVWMPIIAAAAVTALVVGGLLVLTRDQTEQVQPLGPSIVDTTKPVPPTPADWTVVEWGDVRLSLPPDLEPYGPGCSSMASDEFTVVLTCGERELTILSGTAGGDIDPDRRGVTRNGVLTDLVPVPDLADASQLLIPETSSLVRFVGFSEEEIDAIADTVGVSSGWRFRLEPPPPVPEGWQTVELDGFSFRVPPNWGVSTVSATEIDRDVCGFGGVLDRNVLIGRGSLEDATVDCSAERTLLPAVDGVRVLPQDSGPTALLNPYVTVVVGSAQPPQVIRVGLGGDGTIGRTILESILRAANPAQGSAATAPVTTLTPPASPAQRMAAIATVVQVPGGEPQLCREVLPGTPATCSIGVALDGWTWDAIDDETVRADDARIASDVYVEGEFVDEANLLVVSTARRATTLDIDRSALAAVRQTDRSIPCEEPAGGWDSVESSGTATFPVDVVTALPGYAGHWLDPTGRVYVVKTAGDLAAAEVTLREGYQGPVCIAEATWSLAELSAIEIELRSFSSVRFGLTQRIVDARGERVVAESLTPQPELQANLDERYGEGTVVLTSILQPIG